MGLGNPGEQYVGTRHNMGFRAIHQLARAWRFPAPTQHSHSLVAEGFFSHQRIILAQPLTYMNRSGKALGALLGKYVIPLERILIIYDDMDLQLGLIRIREKGGDGGHGGVGSIIRVLGDNLFPRLRIGIGRPPQGVNPSDYVLAPLSQKEEKEMEALFKRVTQAIEILISCGIEQAMNTYNG